MTLDMRAARLHTESRRRIKPRILQVLARQPGLTRNEIIQQLPEFHRGQVIWQISELDEDQLIFVTGKAGPHNRYALTHYAVTSYETIAALLTAS